MISYKNIDCVEYMKTVPDNYFELAIVDPPYFSGPEIRGYYGSKSSRLGVVRFYGETEEWKLPTTEYFEELFRISKNQIIWGINYFTHLYDFGPGRIIWDKCNGKSSFSDCEIAYCSLHDSVRMFKFMWNGMMQGKSITEGHIMQGNKKLNEIRIHPTQKPVALYKWQLMTYGQQDDKIFDSHVGSGSSLIAAHDMGFDMWGCELDENMFTKSNDRLNAHMSQIKFEV